MPVLRSLCEVAAIRKPLDCSCLSATILILAGLVSVSSAQYNHTIYVDPEKGNDSTACLDSSSPSQPCRNLSYAFQPQYRASSTQYVLQPGTHYLNSTASDVPFTDLQDIAITGNSSARVVCFTDNSGVAFVRVSNVKLGNVTFSNCSSRQNSTSRNNFFDTQFEFSTTLVALYFNHSASVSMENVHIVDSPGATGVIMYNTIGANTFTHCSFYNNTNYDPHAYPGGGGIYVEFSYCLPGDKRCENGTEESYTDHNRDSTYVFDVCTFSENIARNVNSMGPSTFILPYREDHEAFGRGGGLSVYLKANTTRNHISVTDCVFEHNQALWGAGMLTAFEDTASGNSVTVSGTRFVENSVFSDANTAGGGMRIGHLVFGEGTGSTGNVITLEGCNFTRNYALSGGGLSFSPARQQATAEKLVSLSLTECHFQDNFAKLGLALHLLRFGLIPDGSIAPVVLVNISVRGSHIRYPNNTKAYEEGGGAVYMNGVWANFLETAYFCNNNGSALMIAKAEASFQNCTAYFVGNRGLKGGAILLLGASSISVNNFTNMTFCLNVAQWKGGAIYNQYIDRDNMAQDPHCFIHHVNPFLNPNKWEATFGFYGNRDHEGLGTIHSTSFYPCVWAGGNIIGSVQEVFCWNGWIYDHVNATTDHCHQYLTSAPGSVNYTYTIFKFPGREVKLPISVRDDLNRSREVAFHAFSLDPDVAVIGEAFEYIAGNTLEFTGIGGKSFTLELDSTTQRTWHLEMKVNILECPPGFIPSGATNHSVCNCSGNSNEAYSGDLLCDETSFNASLTGGHWMGRIQNTSNATVFVTNCPPNFCYKTPDHKYNPLPDAFINLDTHICGRQHRTGIICGKCMKSYGPAVNSKSNKFECVPCKNINVAAHATYYILSVYVPLFLLFLAIIVFNIKLTTGPANAFILYSQVISSTFDLSADGQIPLALSVKHPDKLLLAYQLPYGIFNLQFFERLMKPFCLGSGLNTLDVLVLDYVVGFFPLLMILLVILYVNTKGCLKARCSVLQRLPHHTRISKYFPRLGDSIIPAFASFLLLSYSKFSLTSSYLISRRPLLDETGDPQDWRVYYAGQYSSSNTEYIIRYFVPAIIILVLLCALPPLLLLEYPLMWFEMAIGKVYFLRRRYPATKVQIFLDAFQGCYRHRMRFFAGLYFLFRLIIDLSYTLSSSWTEHYVVQEIVCIVFIIILTICRPYNAEYNIFNYIDVLMFANLAIITALGLYLFAIPHIDPLKNPPLAAFVVQYILVLLPLLCMLVYLSWHFLAPRLIPIFLALKDRRNESMSEHSTLINSRSFAGNLTWNTIASSNSQSGSRTRQRNHDSVSGIDWDRATLTNTYCPSPQRPLVGREEEAAENHPISTDDTETGDSGDATDTPPAKASGYSTVSTAADYGSTGETITAGVSTSSGDDGGGAHQWESSKGHTPEEGERSSSNTD